MKFPRSKEVGKKKKGTCVEFGEITSTLQHSSLNCMKGLLLKINRGSSSLRDRGAWWAAVYGVAQSQTRLKQLSSSSNHLLMMEKQHYWVYQKCSRFIQEGVQFQNSLLITLRCIDCQQGTEQTSF